MVQKTSLTADQVLARYRDDEIPSFYGMELTDVNQAGSDGDRPLHVACIRRDLEEVKALILAGAEVNVPGEMGYYPLHYAAWGSPEIVSYLLEHGARKDVKNEFGKTPFDRV